MFVTNKDAKINRGRARNGIVEKLKDLREMICTFPEFI